MPTIEQISDLIEKYGIGTTILTLVILVVVFLIFKVMSSSNFLSKISNKIFKKINKTKIKISESDIINHELFNYIDFWVYSKIPTIKYSTDFRTVVFRKYLHIYFKSYKDILHIFVNEGKYKEMDNSRLRTTLLKQMTDIIYEHDREMSLQGVPTLVVDKMKSKNIDTLNLTLDLINSIMDSQFYNSDNNLLKVYSFLNIILSILENTMTSSEDVCNSINGELSGLKMDGFVEP